ncbi:beta-ketoacyl synthase chain length factor [Aliarcobacter lanthieri]|uniref:beta-ketoacyl synthase chain length factor n=1 Tax=Aliarcobacter lanthieri TaxID=1355374 RepID=UPI000478EC20|nr:beta-ketoacyl synthase chain length factor [Aliarcobacter lanthieri]
MNINLEILDTVLIYDKEEIKELNTKELVPQMVFRRRLTRASKLVIEALSKLDCRNHRIIYGTSFGELLASSNILKAILDSDILSPTDFQNSVYNTAVSYSSILMKNKNEILTISSGDETSLKVLKAGAIKSLDNDELILVCSETLNIPNIEEINNCIDYLECVAALKVKITEENENISLENIALKYFPKSIEHIVYITQNCVRNKKNIVKIEL